MKRLVPLVIVLAIAGSVGMNCRCDHLKNDKFVCSNDDANKPVHHLKYTRDSNGKVTASVDGSCPAPCSSNSPIVNSFPINGLEITGAGACNPERVRVDPGKAGKPNKCPNGNLQFVKTSGTIVIKNSKGETCAGSDLEGASFTVASSGGNVTLTIKKVAQIPYVDLNKPTDGLGTREGYRIVASLPGSPPDVSVCNAAQANEVRKNLGLGSTIGDYSYSVGSSSGSANEWDDYVIAVPGPLYSNSVKQISFGDSFYNLACATDALAKRTLARVAKVNADPGTQYAALRMLTASYCSKPRTVKGMKVHWEPGSGSGTGSGDTLEGWWNVEGAACLAHPRVEQLASDFMTVYLGSDAIPPACGGNYGHDKCKSWDAYAAAVRDECLYLGSDEDPRALPASCDGTGSAMDYKSYVPTGETYGMNGSGSDQQARMDSAHAGIH